MTPNKNYGGPGAQNDFYDDQNSVSYVLISSNNVTTYSNIELTFRVVNDTVCLGQQGILTPLCLANYQFWYVDDGIYIGHFEYSINEF